MIAPVMKKTLPLHLAVPLWALALVLGIFLVTGCQDLRHMGRGFVASTVGITYHITLYGAGGNVIRDWTIHGSLDEGQGAGVAFFDDKGNHVFISGTYVVEQQ